MIQLLKKILSNSLDLLLSNVLFRGGMFVLNIYIIRLLGKEDYGRFVMIRSTSNLIEGVISGAIGPISIAEIAKDKTKETIFRILKVNILLLILVMILLSIFYEYIAGQIRFENSEVSLIIFIGGLLIATKFYTFIQDVYIGLEKYKDMLYSTIGSVLICGPIAFWLVSNFGLFGAIGSVVTLFLINSIFRIILFSRYSLVTTSNKTSVDFFSIFLKSGFNLLIGVMVSNISFWFARTLLVSEKNGLQEIANFDASFQFLTIVMIVTGATTSVLLPLISKKTDNKKARSVLLKTSLLINIFIVLVISFVFYIAGEYILQLLGEGYSSDENFILLMLMMVVGFFFTINSVFHKVIIAMRLNKFVLLANVIASLIMLSFLKWCQDVTSLSLSYSFILYYLVSAIIYLIVYIQFTKKLQK